MSGVGQSIVFGGGNGGTGAGSPGGGYTRTIVTNELFTGVIRFDRNYDYSIGSVFDISSGALSVPSNFAHNIGNWSNFYIQSDGVSPLVINGVINYAGIFPIDINGSVLPEGVYRVYTRYSDLGLELQVPRLMASSGAADIKPVALNVGFTGSEIVGETLTGQYTYIDGASPSLPESGTTYRWLLADDEQGTNESVVGTGQTYVVDPLDEGGVIRFEVTVANSRDAGNPVVSAWSGIIGTSGVSVWIDDTFWDDNTFWSD